jgi:hypothetical protein
MDVFIILIILGIICVILEGQNLFRLFELSKDSLLEKELIETKKKLQDCECDLASKETENNNLLTDNIMMKRNN